MKKREIGLDILKILSMCGVIGLHIINIGGIKDNINILSVKGIIIQLLLTLFFISINIFGLLSGYFNIEKKTFKNKRIIELISIVMYWSFIITSSFLLFNIGDFRSNNITYIISCYIPFFNPTYWYITCYIFLFFMMPYINNQLNNLNEKQYKKMLIILFILIVLVPSILFGMDIFGIKNGYSIMWLIYLYMIGGYIKKYGINIKLNKCIIYLILSLFVGFILNTISNVINILDINEYWMINYVSPFTLINSILLILIFKNIKLDNKKINKLLCIFSTLAFSVYIIHNHRCIYNVLIDLFVPLSNMNAFIMFISIIGVIVLTYIVCCLLDEIRLFLFKILKINNLIEYLGCKLDSILK